jgi:hypothetical protein
LLTVGGTPQLIKRLKQLNCW